MVTFDPSAAAMLALALLRARIAYELGRVQIRLLKKQIDLAEKYRDIFAEQRAFYRDQFRLKVESAVRFYATHAQFTPDYAANYGGANSFVRDLHFKSRRITFGTTNTTDILFDSYYGRKMKMYGIGRPADLFIDYYIYGQLDLSNVDAIDHTYRYEQYKENIYDARRFDRMTAVAEYSNKHAIAAARDGATSFGAVASAITAKGNFYGARANDMMYGAGNLFQQGWNNLKNQNAPGGDLLTYSRRMEDNTLSLTYNLPNGGSILK